MNAPATTPSSNPAVRSPTATLEQVDIRGELAGRSTRPPNVAREMQALGQLASEMAENPRNMLQKLVEIGVDLCDAHTAGISLLDGDVFRWEAVAGVFASARGGTMPRNQSPCGVCIDRNATELMHLADRCFPALFSEPRFVEALLIPFYDHGRPIGTVWIVSHTFERKFDREDERIVRVLAQFASAGWQLWRSYEAAAESRRRMGDFLATLGHELRGPFGAITTAAAILRERTQDDERSSRAAAIVSRQSLHVSRLLDDLLDLEGIETGKLRLEKQLIDFRAVVAEAIEVRRPQLERRGQTLSADLAEGPVSIEADPVRLAQIVSNLIDNASKYTPDGGQISVAVKEQDRIAALEVQDTGIGVPDEQLERIFEPFVQLPNGNGSNGGFGLGLPLVRRLSELHGGSAAAISAGAGRGTLVTVRFPTSRPVASSATDQHKA